MPASARTGHIATVAGYDVFQDSPDGDAWFALASDALADDEDSVVVYPTLAELMRASRASRAEPSST